MKKTIKILSGKLETVEVKKDGSLQGGFASVKGGYQSELFSTNSSTAGCSNTVDCSKSTNVWNCTNSGICFV